MKLPAVLVTLVAWVNADVYMMFPRASNNRLDEQGRERRNANRMFDSQNNNRGGVNVGGGTTYFTEGSILPIEWTNQHSCGGENAKCELIIQYMCSPTVRDGDRTQTIPDNRWSCRGRNCDTDVRFGMNEPYATYQECKTTERNKGLFTADQNLNQNSATRTRQNPRGQRRAYECPEERDYYPYWRASPWKDIAIMTNDESRCAYYKAESQNVKGRGKCTNLPANYRVNTNTRTIPNNPTSCAAKGGTWTATPAHGLAAPACMEAPWSRDNHNGNGMDGYPNTFNWTIPNDPAMQAAGVNCVTRLRYNISTTDTTNWNENGQTAESAANNNQQTNIGATVGLAANDAATRGYIMKNNPVVKPAAAPGGTANNKLQLQLAVNTAQLARTFQDRSFTFQVKPRPAAAAAADAAIYNIGVKGKRGNIVQVYPSVEYDFAPQKLQIARNDYVHIQWDGSDKNPKNNDGQGRRGTDRSNIVQQNNQQYPEGTPGVAAPVGSVQGAMGTSYPEMLRSSSFLGLGRTDMIKLAVVPPGKELDQAATYFDLGPKKVTDAGTYNYLCTRNNNFSNRSQKGKIIVGNQATTTQGDSLGYDGGEVAADSGEKVKIQPASLKRDVRLRLETWSDEDCKRHIREEGGEIKMGKRNAGDCVDILPKQMFEDEHAKMTVHMKVKSDFFSNVKIFHTHDTREWAEINDVSIQDDGTATFDTNSGGLFVSRTVTNWPIIVGVTMGSAVLVVGAVVLSVMVVASRKNKMADYQGLSPKDDSDN